MELLDIRDALPRIRLEFTHMPEPRITRAQLCRLLTLSADTCEIALGALIHSGFLEKTGDGHYKRAASAQSPRPFKLPGVLRRRFPA
jgi:hypothetical protein